ncbi:IclR family transcriptional regulator [Saccharopolyspora phatthalungensis]|uniref:DNA-binding IclR family transcriptional regulator n=1 Tax=Saccharopolyspora phatthalungensis TaxID=664693 RepID=A0A840QIT9_9PSEU|nr:IclR family transcriptional regulator [Saccharopolyspora phatthalungensis]MBB5158689.1 DNA-binding IclR family transcriptional regulator [Saccharopolyspora phatthalungensis]
MDSTLLKGLRVLETLALSPTPRGVSELARELGLARSNAHRTLQTLAAAGYVRAADTAGTYECTLKLFELSSAIMDRVDVRRLATPHTQRLADVTQETVHLAALEGAAVVYLDKIESPQPVRAYSSIGGRAPAHCVASGKALLARLSHDDLAAVVGEALVSYTDRTITDPAALRQELAEVRERGWAVNRGEWRSSVSGLAAVIFNAQDEPEAAVGVSGPTDRLLPKIESSFRDEVLKAAEGISRELGCRDYWRAAARATD